LFAPAVNPLLKIAQSLSKPAEGVGSGGGTGGGGGSWGGGGGGGGQGAATTAHSQPGGHEHLLPHRPDAGGGGIPAGPSNQDRYAATAAALQGVMDKLGPHPAPPGTAQPAQRPGTILQREAASGVFRHLLPFQKQLPEWQSYGGRKLTTKEGILASLGEDQANPQYLEDAMLQTAGELRKAGYKFDDPALLNAIGRGSTYKPGMNLSELLASQAGAPGTRDAAAYTAAEQRPDGRRRRRRTRSSRRPPTGSVS
jgi:hypothetical protein